MSSTCCGGSCGCGSACKCQSICGGCKMNPDITYSETATTNTTVTGVAPNRSCHEGSEMGAAASEHDGCKCGASCTCNPCTCK